MNREGEQLRLLSIFHYVVGGLAALAGCIPILHVIVGLVVLVAPDKLELSSDTFKGSGSPDAVGWLFVTVGILLIVMGWVLAGLLLASGRFIAQRKHYRFCFVMAFVQCFFIPFGTALGIASVIVLLRPSVKAIFSKDEPTAALI